jgi:transposase
MSKRIFSSEELERLRTNPNILRVSAKSITYTIAFKEHAVAEYEAGATTREIFRRAGLDPALVRTDHPKNCLKRWRRVVRRSGTKGLVDTRGKHHTNQKKRSINNETNRLKWLEAEVKYLKAENAFLTKLRAKRAE